MKSASAPLIALLNGATTLVTADLLTLTLSGGQVIRWAGADKGITLAGTSWLLGPAFKRSKITTKVGVSVDTLELEIYADATVLVNGTPLLAFIAGGGLDNARVVLERAFGASWAAGMTDKLRMFSGRVGEIDLDALTAKIKVKSDLELLDVPVPRNVYQPSCLNTFCDLACGQSVAARTGSVVASSASDALQTTFSAVITGLAGQVPLGIITGTSGANLGVSATIKSTASGQITLIGPLPKPVSVGDTFSILAGCDKTQATCSGVYGNLARFRGFPYIPTPETAA